MPWSATMNVEAAEPAIDTGTLLAGAQFRDYLAVSPPDCPPHAAASGRLRPTPSLLYERGRTRARMLCSSQPLPLTGFAHDVVRRSVFLVSQPL
jgi:hypothetical protein